MTNEDKNLITENALRNVWSVAWDMWRSGIPGKFMFTYNLLVRWYKQDKSVEDPETGKQIFVRTVIAAGKGHPMYVLLKHIIKDIAESGLSSSKFEPKILTRARKKMQRAIGIDGYVEIADREAKKVAKAALRAERDGEEALVKVVGVGNKEAFAYTAKTGQKYLAIAAKGTLTGGRASLNQIQKVVKLQENKKVEINKKNIRNIIKEEIEDEIKLREKANLSEGAISKALTKLSPTGGADSMDIKTLVAFLLLKFILDEFSNRLPKLLRKYDVSVGSHNIDSLIRGSLGVLAKTLA